MGPQDISILHLPAEMRYLQIDLTTYVQKRFRSKLLGFRSLPRLKVISENENRKLNGTNTSLINFKVRTIYINVNPALTPARQWEEALGDTVHENLHDVWDLFPKDEKWDATKCRLMNIFMDGRNEQYASSVDNFSARLLSKMREHAFSDLETSCPRKEWFNGDPLWASSYLSLKIHTGLMVLAPELLREFQSGKLTPKNFWRKTKSVLKLRNPPKKLHWTKAWEIICKFWLSGNIYQKSRLVDSFRALYPPPATSNPSTTAEDRNGHQGIPVPGQSEEDGQTSQNGEESQNTGETGTEDIENDNSGNGESDEIEDHQTRPEPNQIPEPKRPKSTDEVEKEINDEKCPSQGGSSETFGGTIYPTDGRSLEDKAKLLSHYLKREISILTAPKQRTVTVSSNRIKMQKVLKNPNTRDPWKKRRETELDRNVVSLKFIGDTSGSMDDCGKLEAMKMALAVFHEVCSSINEIEHEVYTSVGLQLIASSKMSRKRGFNLLEGLETFGGDDFETTLPILLKNLKGGKEIVFIFTDGQPGNIELLSELIQKTRRTGVIIFGIGLNIQMESDKRGMKTLFGDDFLLAKISGRNGEDFARQMAISLRNLVRRRLY